MKYSAAHQGFRNITSTIDAYCIDNMLYSRNAAIATLLPEMVGHFRPSASTNAPPIGRAWDWNGTGSGTNNFGINLSIQTASVEDRAEMERRFG